MFEREVHVHPDPRAIRCRSSSIMWLLGACNTRMELLRQFSSLNCSEPSRLEDELVCPCRRWRGSWDPSKMRMMNARVRKLIDPAHVVPLILSIPLFHGSMVRVASPLFWELSRNEQSIAQCFVPLLQRLGHFNCRVCSEGVQSTSAQLELVLGQDGICSCSIDRGRGVKEC